MDQQCVIVANQTMLEVFRTSLVRTTTENKVEFTRVLLVQLNDLPLHLIGRLDSLQFDLYDKNVFYAIGSTNEAFENELSNEEDEAEEMKGLAKKTSRMRTQFRIEKFFIDCEETFQSQTMCFLELPEAHQEEPFGNRAENIVMYQNSQGHDLVAVVTDKQSVYIYSLCEMRSKFY